MIIVAIVRACRAVTEECMKWAQQREVFGKPLIEQPVIRAHLASMVAQTEACHAWLERITFQMDELQGLEQGKIAKNISLLKYLVTRTSLGVSEKACQIFGGRAITKKGMGQPVYVFAEHLVYNESAELLHRHSCGLDSHGRRSVAPGSPRQVRRAVPARDQVYGHLRRFGGDHAGHGHPHGDEKLPGEREAVSRGVRVMVDGATKIFRRQ